MNYRASRVLTSFDDLFKPELPSSEPYAFKEGRDTDKEWLRDRIRRGMEDTILPTYETTPVKIKRTPLKEQIRSLLNSERSRKRQKGWLDKLTGNTS
jgi:hypothetical protein